MLTKGPHRLTKNLRAKLEAHNVEIPVGANADEIKKLGTRLLDLGAYQLTFPTEPGKKAKKGLRPL